MYYNTQLNPYTRTHMIQYVYYNNTTARNYRVLRNISHNFLMKRKRKSLKVLEMITILPSTTVHKSRAPCISCLWENNRFVFSLFLVVVVVALCSSSSAVLRLAHFIPMISEWWVSVCLLGFCWCFFVVCVFFFSRFSFVCVVFVLARSQRRIRRCSPH